MTVQDVERRIKRLTSLVGNTPLLEIQFTFEGKKRILYAKAENLNMTGSIKDRMAFHIMEKAYARRILGPEAVIIEATSGNTGIAFAAIGRALGHQVTIFMPDWLSEERINLIRSFGAQIVLVSRNEGGFLGSIRRAEELAESSKNSFLPRQFSNEDNIEAHYMTTGPEIWWQLKAHGLSPDALVCGVGTGGTIMGAGRFLREQKPTIRLYPLEPSNSPTLSTGHKVGKHRIQGISDEFIPPILDLKALNQVISVDDGDAIIMAQKLAGQLGLGVGISSGANFLGALQVQNELGREAIVITVFPDDNKKYLSTDLMREEPEKKGFLSPHIQLLEFQSFKRVWQTCCNPQECREATSSAFGENSVPPGCPLFSSVKASKTR